MTDNYITNVFIKHLYNLTTIYFHTFITYILLVYIFNVFAQMAEVLSERTIGFL